MYRAVKHMLRSFKIIEKPFILDTRGERNHPYLYSPRQNPFAAEKGFASAREREEDIDDYYNTEYCEPSLYQRLIWIRRRGSVLAMFEKLSRVQTRRIARTTTEIRL